MSRFRLSAITAVLLFTASLTPLHVYAQDDDGDTDTEAAHGGNASAAARLQVRINELEEQVRRLQGALEQTSFANKQLKTQMDKMRGDIEYRLNALEQHAPAGGAPATAAPASQAPAVNPQSPAEVTNLNDDDAPKPNHYVPSVTAAPQPQADNTSQALPNFPSSHEHYSYAFKLMNQAKYEEASAAFDAFTQRYPKDPLIGNAYYWLGETYYVRKDYVKAADNFSEGYKAMPTGPKAADNLLKLAMALSAQNKDKESCVVLKQVNVKFSKTSGSIKSRVESEMNRLDCR